MSETSYGTAQAGAQTLAAGSLRDFRVPFVSGTENGFLPPICPKSVPVPDTLSAQTKDAEFAFPH